ncbi:hypothetical protein [Tateyamaria pelophila]|nr:hypothetical protein [Tateyamaria pelophila]
MFRAVWHFMTGPMGVLVLGLVAIADRAALGGNYDRAVGSLEPDKVGL